VGHRYSKYLSNIHFLGDLLGFNASFIASFYLKFDTLSGVFDQPYISLYLVANLTWLVITLVFKPHEVGRTSKITAVLARYFLLIGLHLLVLSAYWVLTQSYFYSREQLIVTYLLFPLFIIVWKTTLLYSLRIYRKSGFNTRTVVIAGYGELAENLRAYFLQHPEYGYRLAGFFDRKSVGPKILGTVDQLPEYAKQHKIDEIYCCLPNIRYSQVKKLVNFGEENLVKVKLIADFRAFSSKKVEFERYDHIPVINVTSKPLDSHTNRVLKRMFDIAFASAVIIGIFSWLFPIIALAVKISSPGPVFFKQKRTGINNKSFWCYKFRTMRVNNDSDKKQATKGDNRITKVGAFLRKTSLDELPQFFNVLLGDMSVVGPRPHMLKHTEEYSKLVEKFMARHFVKPGITGLAQCKGYRGETEHISAMEGRVRLDRFYVEHWSFYFDIKIVILTVLAMIKGEENAY
jgi:putative colanic acid biosysnthesis UDP-glucose lipid carrier transferase